MSKLIYSIVFCLFMMTTSIRAQHVYYKSTKHYADRVGFFEKNPSVDSTKIVMLGNSLTEFGKDWNVRLGITNSCNYGIMGDNARGILNRLCQITPYHPKAIFLMVGINDIYPKLSAQSLFGKCRSVIDSIRVQTPSSRLYVQSILPVNESFHRWKTLEGQSEKIVKTNALLKEYCANIGITYIDVYSRLVIPGTTVLPRSLTADGLHVNESGYAIWSKVIREYIIKDKLE